MRYWARLGCVSFGGPAGQIALMHRDLVERRGWIAEDRFLHALNFCMLLPGPEAQQLAIYIGWLLHGVAGGLAAGVLFVLPSIFVLLGLSWVYTAHGSLPAVAAALAGLKPVVVAIVLAAMLRIGRRALRGPAHLAIAAAAFVAIRLLDVPFPLIVFAAAAAGLLAGDRRAAAEGAE
ncbi:MAG TPA: chromate transporter, partial [Thermoanaerobaculia bacterium]|nr:chromate transporter [Thermoanaerobaculia bacterium]